MELLYVWIEEYKNIKQQGFCFSAEYDIEYTPENNTLKIDKREDYIEGFWGERITNLTAVVGENGAGKSSLLRFIHKHFPLFNLTSNDTYSLGFILIYDKQVYYSQGTPFEIGGNAKGEFKNKQQLGQLSDVRSYLEKLPRLFYSNVYSSSDHGHRALDLSTSNLLRYSKATYEDSYPSNTMAYDQEEIRRQLNFLKDFSIDKLQNNGNGTLDSLKSIAYVRISFYKPRVSEGRRLRGKLLHFSEAGKASEETSFNDQFCLRFIMEVITTADRVNNFAEESEKFQNEVENINKTFDSPKAFINVDRISSYLNYLNYNLKENAELRPSLVLDKFKELIQLIQELDDYVEKHSKSLLLPLTKQHIENILSFTKVYLPTAIFRQEWVSNKAPKTIINLSGGEQTMLSLMARFYSVCEIRDSDSIFVKSAKHILVLIDEGELTLHPEWQRKYINILLDFFQVLFSEFDNGVITSVAKQVQIILTTHSPLILSDIPKENVVFLKKREDGTCEVASDAPKQTFGANIHTLLADSFFLQGSLMGEHAKHKINKIIKIMRNDEEQGYDEEIPDIATLEKYIKKVGEPLLKMQLEKQLAKFKEEDPDEIQKEIDRLTSLKQQLMGGNND
jgi:predicted ATP-binding protein involved in virulence